LIAEKEEGSVLDDRAADGAAELILLEDWLFRARAIGEEVCRVEFVVAQEFVERTVKLISPAFGRDDDLRARRIAELRRSVVGQHLEFADCFHRRLDGLRFKAERAAAGSRAVVG